MSLKLAMTGADNIDLLQSHLDQVAPSLRLAPPAPAQRVFDEGGSISGVRLVGDGLCRLGNETAPQAWDATISDTSLRARLVWHESTLGECRAMCAAHSRCDAFEVGGCGLVGDECLGNCWHFRAPLGERESIVARTQVGRLLDVFDEADEEARLEAIRQMEVAAREAEARRAALAARRREEAMAEAESRQRRRVEAEARRVEAEAGRQWERAQERAQRELERGRELERRAHSQQPGPTAGPETAGSRPQRWPPPHDVTEPEQAHAHAREVYAREPRQQHAHNRREALRRAQERPQEQQPQGQQPQGQLPPPPEQRAQQRAAEEAPPQPWAPPQEAPPQDPDYARSFQQQMRWVFGRVESEGGMPPVPTMRRTPMVRETELKGKLVRFLAGMRAFERQQAAAASVGGGGSGGGSHAAAAGGGQPLPAVLSEFIAWAGDLLAGESVGSGVESGGSSGGSGGSSSGGSGGSSGSGRGGNGGPQQREAARVAAAAGRYMHGPSGSSERARAGPCSTSAVAGEEEDVCCICQEGLADELACEELGEPFETACGHQLHALCYARLMETAGDRQPLCPMCRSDNVVIRFGPARS